MSGTTPTSWNFQFGNNLDFNTRANIIPEDQAENEGAILIDPLLYTISDELAVLEVLEDDQIPDNGPNEIEPAGNTEPPANTDTSTRPPPTDD
ncbi:hypothetical protein BGX26_009272 [Mortierella sp. AD094]|nr:hypothetical protein BGX26_009272 [Mortierella sp. AD094]